MIKAVTYQGNHRFNANLYALEIKSRFIDQAHADGYYTGYGSELEAKIIGNQIQIGTGAFVVQGRMNEVVSTEVITPSMYNNFVGYVVAHIETYHIADDNNCTFKAYVNTALSEIPLRQDDVYAMNADNENLVYELPIYSFEIKDGAITNLQKLIKPIDDYSRVQKEIQLIQQSIQEALESVQSAKENLTEIALSAQGSAAAAVEAATSANTNATNANTSASQAVLTAEQAINKVNDLEEKVKAGGTVVKVAGVAQTEIPFERDPQSQINEIISQLENGVGGGGSAYKGDLKNDPTDVENILVALCKENHLIFRVPSGYNVEYLYPFVDASLLDTKQVGYIEFIGKVDFQGDIESGEAELNYLNVHIDILNGNGTRTTSDLEMGADGESLVASNTLSLQKSFFDNDIYYTDDDMSGRGIYLVKIGRYKIGELSMNGTPFILINGAGVMPSLAGALTVIYSDASDSKWLIFDSNGMFVTNIEDVGYLKLA